MSVFSSLNTAYSGLSSSQLMVDTTSHNISNANNDYYTRQRVTVENALAIKSGSIMVGSGVDVEQVSRIHNSFVYDRYRTATTELEFAETEFRYLDEVSSYFSDIDGTSIYNDIENYFNAWETFSMNPTDSSHKIALAQYTNNLTDNLQYVYGKIENLQSSINEQVKVAVEEFNEMGSKIAEINQKIKESEANPQLNANDLRDQRNKLELSMSKLLNINVQTKSFESNASIDVNMQDSVDHYNITLGGYSLLNAEEFHPLELDNKNIASGLYNIKYEGVNQTDVTNLITGGKVGALLDLRGHEVDEFTTKPYDGKLQSYMENLDSFAKGFIEYSNNEYAKGAKNTLVGEQLTYKDNQYNDVILDANTTLSSLNFNINTTYNSVLEQAPSFDVVVYDNAGNELGTKTVTLDNTSTMQSIVDSINSNTDDNADNDLTNDINDYFTASFTNGVFKINPTDTSISKEYTVAISDNAGVSSNFAGVTGVGRVFDGSSVSDMSLKRELKEDPLKINAYASPADGDNGVANAMLQLQYEKKSFYKADGSEFATQESLSSFYKIVTTEIAADANSISILKDTKASVKATVKTEFDNVSKVSLDEELSNLLKFQASYQANAKVVSTIDQMIDTLLGLKK